MIIENVAVFLQNQRTFKGVNAEVVDGEVILRNRVNNAEINRYSIVEVAKEGMAWDINDPTAQEPGQRLRLVVQQGCGCSGMLPYWNDESYTGPFTIR